MGILQPFSLFYVFCTKLVKSMQKLKKDIEVDVQVLWKSCDYAV